MRGLNATILAEIAKRRISTFHLLKMEWGGGTEYFTDAQRDITYLGDVYLASGDFLEFSTPPESLDITSSSITIEMSGAAQANIHTMLSEKYASTPVSIWRGLFDDDLQPVDDPFMIFFGYVDKFNYQEDPESGDSSIGWVVSSHWVDFERKAGRRTNSTDQALYFSADKGFEFAPLVKDDIRWGRD